MLTSVQPWSEYKQRCACVDKFMLADTTKKVWFALEDNSIQQEFKIIINQASEKNKDL